MNSYKGIEDFPTNLPSIVTSGTFDGVHLGHQKILKKIVQSAKKSGFASVVVTFWPHPRFVLKAKGDQLKLLSTFEEKSELLEAIGIDHLVRIPFTKDFSQLSSEEFIQKVLVQGIHTKKLVIGYDHRFGKNREGGFEFLKANASRYGFEVQEISREDIDNVGISSTKIRKALSEGALSVAKDFLGRPYSLTGEVQKGDQLGRTLGYPTANIHVKEDYKLIPADGAYAVRVYVKGKWYDGMMNIGVRPTVAGQKRSIETHIFDFSQDIYGQEITVDFIHLLRKEMKFDSLKSLKDQLKQDQEKALRILEEDH